MRCGPVGQDGVHADVSPRGVRGLGGTLFASVDGVQLGNLDAYLAISPVFTFTADPALAQIFDPCIIGTPQPGVSLGYWLLLTPLPPGNHVVRFGSVGFGQDVTYNLSVTPCHH